MGDDFSVVPWMLHVSVQRAPGYPINYRINYIQFRFNTVVLFLSCKVLTLITFVSPRNEGDPWAKSLLGCPFLKVIPYRFCPDGSSSRSRSTFRVSIHLPEPNCPSLPQGLPVVPGPLVLSIPEAGLAVCQGRPDPRALETCFSPSGNLLLSSSPMSVSSLDRRWIFTPMSLLLGFVNHFLPPSQTEAPYKWVLISSGVLQLECPVVILCPCL